jgi:hypothetical protein
MGHKAGEDIVDFDLTIVTTNNYLPVSIVKADVCYRGSENVFKYSHGLARLSVPDFN